MLLRRELQIDANHAINALCMKSLTIALNLRCFLFFDYIFRSPGANMCTLSNSQSIGGRGQILVVNK